MGCCLLSGNYYLLMAVLFQLTVSISGLKDLVFHEGFQRENIPSSEEWREETLVGPDGFRMRIAYRVVCDPNYYGPVCNAFCQPISTTIGHFQCASNGSLVCKSGWTGRDCDIG
ncbi:unnamed protein product [Anisakis simplex]|uniref:Delta-like protein n=1 Tax=Anisakis simplex TaxID=6269 RepID=A0A0M3J2M9_ANISI|nr:unnamed protein product [Anisakis simplex]